MPIRIPGQSWKTASLYLQLPWFRTRRRNQFRRRLLVITTAQLHSAKPGLRFCAGWNPARGVSEIWDDENLWQWSRLEIRLYTFQLSTTLQKQFNSLPSAIYYIKTNSCICTVNQLTGFSIIDNTAKYRVSWERVRDRL